MSRELRLVAVLGPLLGLLLSASACSAPRVPLLARAQVAPDFDTYAIRRVAVLPPRGPRDVDQARPEALRELQDDLLGFLGQGTPYEGVEISERELGEIELGEPLRDGVLEVETLLALARRFKVDAVLYTAVTRERIYSPLALGLQAELVAVDTGQVVWAADVQLDAADEPVREAVRLYYRRRHGETEGGGGWEVSLIAPRRFARFGAWQLVQML